MTVCFHCGLPANTEGVTKISATIEGELRVFCCHGCLLVAQTIHQGGLDNYYRFREGFGEKPLDAENDFLGYDLPEIQSQFCTVNSNGIKTARLSVGGISCAACAWLIEHHIGNLTGVVRVNVNATTRQCLLQWDSECLALSRIFTAFLHIGYQPQPDREQEKHNRRTQESRKSLMRLGVAGIGMMQVGMVAVALYAGGLQGIESHWQQFLRWVSLVMATPVVLYSAQPFFISAYRSLSARHLNMDVPVSLAIALAYVASVWATLTRSGEVYFDSVSMFTFFLLLGRFLEMRARHSSAFAQENLQQILPLSVKRMEGEELRSVPLAAVVPGNTLRVAAGEVIPVDGRLLSTMAYIDESLLTGESLPQKKIRDASLYAGTLNRESAISLAVSACGGDTQLAAIEALVDQASLEKPRQITLADRIAGRFVATVLIMAVLVGAYWWYMDAQKALWVVLSVLVVTCPCALSLATPAALTAGVNRARKMGALITGPQALECFGKISHAVFDKTGTLTEGATRVSDVQLVEPHADLDKEYLLNLIAELERHSSHPIAKAFAGRDSKIIAKQVEVVLGQGVKGEVDGQQYYFGRCEFAGGQSEGNLPNQQGQWQLLSRVENGKSRALMWVCLADTTRDSAAGAVMDLTGLGIKVSLLSGDRSAVVLALANTLGITLSRAEALPEDKLAFIYALQKQGKRVLMVGDGINDVPVLSAAHVSMAMGAATQLAQSKADSVLLNGKLDVIPKLVTLSNRVQGIIRQNLAWALLYNGLALPAAAAGLLPPYVAAIGMSLSSLVVVLNAMRV